MKPEDKEKIITIVRKSGIVGAGGAGFPTYVKLKSSVEFLLINGAECEPLLMVDQFLMEIYPDELTSAARVVCDVVGARKAIFCLKAKYTKAQQSLLKAIGKQNAGSIELLEDRYPVGDEHVLVYEVLKRIVPAGGIPLAVKALVINVETLFNIYRAVTGKLPVTHSYVTVVGDIKEPFTLAVPLGVPIRDVITYAGDRVSAENHVVLEGGPLMGRLVQNWNAPITKTTKGLIVLKKTDVLAACYTGAPRQIQPNIAAICCECRQCTEICPRFLLGHSIEPHKLIVARAQQIKYDDPLYQSAQYCSECGLCELYACFMGLSPRKVNAEIRQELARRNIKAQNNKRMKSPHPLRSERRIPTARIKARLGISKYDKKSRFITNPEWKTREYTLLLRQHIGIPCSPLVSPGDHVTKGQVIADVTPDALGVPVHTPVDGIVHTVDNDKIRICIP